MTLKPHEVAELRRLLDEAAAARTAWDLVGQDAACRSLALYLTLAFEDRGV